ncbi:hypothetical protein CVT26_003938 [Gymnopilus dilepis]|uniref:Cleavage/polyadenylation specificity factor A subunit N-terminal domain-containing protein n=1 Tax=Gymnopilus dilepis TaxID=231916 RepID=A0A409X1P5_9AGAR|nr:hypothetical protein CVT26_003938 [Gymnopilus dilepis]
MKNAARINDIALAIGGRYMVSLSVNLSDRPASTLFSLWDLGISSYHPIQILTRFLEPRVGLELRLFFPDPTIPHVFFIVSVQRSSPIVVLVHQVSLLNHSSITFLTSLEMRAATPSDPCLVDLLPESHKIMVSTKCNRKISWWIWDFLNNTGARLIGPDWSVTKGAHLLPFNDIIIFASRNMVAVYNTPPTTCSYLSDQIIPKHDALLVVEVSSAASEAFYIHHHSCSPTTRKSTDCRYLLRLDSHRLTVLELIPIPGDDPLVPKKCPVRKGDLDVSDAKLYGAAQGSHIDGCGEYICVSGLESNGASVSMLQVRLSGKNGRTVNLDFLNAGLGHASDIEVDTREFCPFLGRECILASNGQVILYDYLVPR